MRKHYYLPPSANGRNAWLKTFSTVLNNTYGAVFGITPAQLSLLMAMATYHDGLVKQLFSLHASVKSWTAYKNQFCNSRKGSPLQSFPAITITMPPVPAEGGLWDFVRSLVRIIKAHPAYAENIGKGLGIIGAEPAFDKNSFKPEISLRAKRPGEVQLNYVKGPSDGMNFYCSTNGGAWQKRGFDTQPPFVDRTPLAVKGVPEKRVYRCLAVMADVEIGQYSNELEVTVGD
jgi:hypothetical protein